MTDQRTAIRLPWAVLVILSGAAFATVTAELLPAGLLPQLSADLEVSQPTAGWLVGAWALTIAAASVPLTRLTARIPRRVLVPAVLLIFAMAVGGTAFAPSFGWALGARLLAAGAHGLFWSLLVPMVATLVPAELVGRAVSVVLAGPALAGIVGIPLGTTIGVHLGWRTAFIVLAALLAAAAVATRTLTLPQPAKNPEKSTASGGTAQRTVLAVALGGGLVLTGHFALYTYIAALLQQYGGYGATATAALLLVFGATGVAGIAASGRLSDRHPGQALAWVSAAFAISAAGLGLLDTDLVVAVIVIGVWGTLIGALPPVFQTHLLRIAPPGREAAAGAIGITVLNLGIAAGAALGGVVVDHWRAGALPLVAAAVIAVPAGGFLIAGARRHRLDQPG